MGALIAKFRDISKLQKSRKANQDSQKRVVTRLIIYSIILYAIGAVIFFLLYFPDTWPLRLLYSLPLLIFPFLIWCLKKLLHWYFVKRIASNDVALRELREKKKQILEDVMETETYKKAKEILEKFDPARFRKLEGEDYDEDDDDDNLETSPGSPQGTPGTALIKRSPNQAATPARPISTVTAPRQRQTPPTPTPVQRPVAPRPFTPLRAPTTNQMRAPTSSSSQMRAPTPMANQRAPTPYQGTPAGPGGPPRMGPPGMGRGMMAPGPPMARSVLPRERGTMDRLMDYLVGDGPENRYALICQMCHSHNGMALKEEFEYLSFRCCYCYYMNPARKQRPKAPRMEFFSPLAKGEGQKEDANGCTEESGDDDDDESEDEDGSDEKTSSTKSGKDQQANNATGQAGQAGVKVRQGEGHSSGTGASNIPHGPGVSSAPKTRAPLEKDGPPSRHVPAQLSHEKSHIPQRAHTESKGQADLHKGQGPKVSTPGGQSVASGVPTRSQIPKSQGAKSSEAKTAEAELKEQRSPQEFVSARDLDQGDGLATQQAEGQEVTETRGDSSEDTNCNNANGLDSSTELSQETSEAVDRVNGHSSTDCRENEVDAKAASKE